MRRRAELSVGANLGFAKETPRVSSIRDFRKRAVVVAAVVVAAAANRAVRRTQVSNQQWSLLLPRFVPRGGARAAFKVNHTIDVQHSTIRTLSRAKAHPSTRHSPTRNVEFLDRYSIVGRRAPRPSASAERDLLSRGRDDACEKMCGFKYPISLRVSQAQRWPALRVSKVRELAFCVLKARTYGTFQVSEIWTIESCNVSSDAPWIFTTLSIVHLESHVHSVSTTLERLT